MLCGGVKAELSLAVEWLLQGNKGYGLGKSACRDTGSKAGVYGEVVGSEGGKPKISQETGFADVDTADYEGLPVSTVLKAHYPAAKRHRIATLLVPYKLDAPKRIFNFMDDQGYDADLYFTDPEEHTFRVVMKKLANS